MQIRKETGIITTKDVESALPSWLQSWECSRKEMLGSSAYFVNRNLFAMLKPSEVVVRLPELVANELLNSDLLARRLTSADGRVCKEFVVLRYATAPDSQQLSSLRQWMERSARFATTLPARTRLCSMLSIP